jgi:hypothetical protein
VTGSNWRGIGIFDGIVQERRCKDGRLRDPAYAVQSLSDFNWMIDVRVCLPAFTPLVTMLDGGKAERTHKETKLLSFD